MIDRETGDDECEILSSGSDMMVQCSEVVLDEKLKTEATAIGVHWDLPIVTVQNRYWYAQQLLVHAVVDRRQKAVQQVQKGLKECGILKMVQRQPATVSLLFPPASEADIDREAGSQHELKNLIKFWIGWDMLPTSLHVEIKDDVDFPVASTCFETLKIPSKYRSYESFKEELVAISSSYNAGFGQV
ncbi:UNVERIFIED_CONTAM: hypothetical protein FKN15_023209 [Acipenser sinensis]